MLTIFYRHQFLSVVIFALLFFSIICQVMLGVIFHKMINESDNMPTTDNKLLKQCKLKFISCYKLNGRMLNTSVFVDKFISKIHILGISLTRFSHLAGQMMLLSVLVTGVSICISLAGGDTLFQIIPYYLVSILGLYLYFSVSGFVDISGKKNQLRTNIVDYLENHLLPRLELEKETEKKHFQPEMKEEQDSQENEFSDYTEELEDLLKEFFA